MGQYVPCPSYHNLQAWKIRMITDYTKIFKFTEKIFSTHLKMQLLWCSGKGAIASRLLWLDGYTMDNYIQYSGHSE